VKEFDRIIETLDIIAAELERLRILKEHELGVRIAYEEGDPYVASRKPAEE
jgi:hypothetical protein